MPLGVKRRLVAQSTFICSSRKDTACNGYSTLMTVLLIRRNINICFDTYLVYIASLILRRYVRLQ
jgi:hypothetical protein